MDSEKPVWRIDTESLATEIERAIRNKVNEEQVKMAVEPILRKAFVQIGIDVEMVQYEKSVTSLALKAKRIDALYGFLVIEYEGPGKLAKKKTRDESIEQVKNYLNDEANLTSDREAYLEKAVGVALDGSQIAFVRYSPRAQIMHLPAPIQQHQGALFPDQIPQVGFQVQGPYPIRADSLANLLILARCTARRKLTAEELARVFGPEQDVARTAVSQFYTAALRGQRRGQKVATFFAEWDRLFGVVYGEEMDSATNAAAEAARTYDLPSSVRTKPLLFAIHTYYALLMKLIAVELTSLQQGMKVQSFINDLSSLDPETLKSRLESLESGDAFQTMGIRNFMEADFFSWYLEVWDESLEKAVRSIIRALADFEPSTPILAPDYTRDLLQNLYECVVPKALRHALGEYYTPDWLASHVVDLSEYNGDPNRRFLDPACGSGTFLVQAIRRVHQWIGRQDKVDVPAVGRKVLENVVGFDLNPLAVLAARTNYLIAYAPFLPYVCPLSLPVYLCDSVVPPDRDQAPQGALFNNDVVVFRTQEHEFAFPLSMHNRDHIDTFCNDVLTAIRSRLDATTFRRMLSQRKDLNEDEATKLEKVYAHIKALHDEGRDGIWANYIKNAFAPVYTERFDHVVGNPPWIRWGYLSAQYRERTLPLWQRYGLFSLKGHEARLGQGEKDFSMLFTYACADRYMKDGGSLTFVITYEVFKSKGAGEGFRRFCIGKEGVPLKVDHIEDMVNLQPFNAANKTCVFRIWRGQKTVYPVRVVEWRRKMGVGRIPMDWSREKVLAGTSRRELQGSPVDPDKLVSALQTIAEKDINKKSRIKGPSHYKAYRGICSDPYGVFWLRFVTTRPDGKIVIENLHDRGKLKIKPLRVAIEPLLIYPGVAGGNLTRFGIRDFVYILLCQEPAKRTPYSEEWMLENTPLTHAYLSEHKETLLARGSSVIRNLAQRTSFYAMFGVSEHTLAPYRVTWKRMAQRLEAVVLSEIETPFGWKSLIGTDTTSFLPTTSEDEAHFLCALLNSEPVDSYIRSFSAPGRGFGAPSVIQNVALPKFDPTDNLHRELAALSREAHEMVKMGQDLVLIQTRIDDTSKKLWTIES